MIRKTVVLAAFLGFAGMASADFPLMNMVADKVIQKYQTSTCEQLWAQKQQPKSEQEQRADRPAEERPAAALCVPEQGRRPDLEQDVRVRHDPLTNQPHCAAVAGGTPDRRFLQ